MHVVRKEPALIAESIQRQYKVGLPCIAFVFCRIGSLYSHSGIVQSPRETGLFQQVILERKITIERRILEDRRIVAGGRFLSYSGVTRHQ